MPERQLKLCCLFPPFPSPTSYVMHTIPFYPTFSHSLFLSHPLHFDRTWVLTSLSLSLSLSLSRRSSTVSCRHATIHEHTRRPHCFQNHEPKNFLRHPQFPCPNPPPCPRVLGFIENTRIHTANTTTHTHVLSFIPFPSFSPLLLAPRTHATKISFVSLYSPTSPFPSPSDPLLPYVASCCPTGCLLSFYRCSGSVLLNA